MIDLNELLKNLISSATILAILGYLGKQVIKTYLDKNIEQHKNNLNRETELLKNKLNQETELFKNELNRLATEHKVKYSMLHKERAEVIKNIYNITTKHHDTWRAYIKFLNSHEVLDDNPELKKTIEDYPNIIKQTCHEMLTTYNYNKIYFSKETCEILDRYFDNATDVSFSITTLDNDMLAKIDTELERNFVGLSDELISQFREILGA